MATVTADQITAGLKKLGPVSPGELADHLQVDRQALGYALKPLLDDGTVKATGSTANRRVALPDQKFDTPAAPPQARKKKRKGKMAKRAKAKPAAPKPAPAARDFLTAITADKRLVVISGEDELQIYSEAETESIRALVLEHMEA